MGKKGGSSWLTAVKRAFRSPTKDITQEKARNCIRKEDHNPNPNLNPPSEDQDDKKKREKRRWLFKKGNRTQSDKPPDNNAAELADRRHAIAVAVASAAAAEAAVAATKAVVEVARLTRATPTYTNPRETYAAILIQTSFRGYLARRALRALKGLVKLQALVRGHNVRKQAKMTLQCMQALVRVQAQVLDQRLRLSHEGFDKRSTSHSREVSRVEDDWDERGRPHSIEEVKAMLLSRKEAAALRRERNLSQAFSHQTWRSDRSSSIGGGAEREEMEEKPRMWLDRWKKASKDWDSSSVVSPSPVVRGRASTDHRHSIKTLEVDTTYRRSTSTTPNHRPSSPLHTRAHHHPSTPSPSRARPSSPSSRVSQTPSLRSTYCYSTPSSNKVATTVPSYMAATKSARARARAHSAPRQRPPSTPERDWAGPSPGPKKRLSFPNYPDPCGGVLGYGLRSPSFKSVVEQQSMYSSCCTESIGGGEISPSSSTDLRRWFR